LKLRAKRSSDQQGLGARRVALGALQAIFFNERPLGEALDGALSQASLDARDAAFARAIVMMVLRRLGELDNVACKFLREPLPVRAGPAELILRIAAAELLFLDVAPHAAVSSALALADRDARARHFKGLINAVARRIAGEGKAYLDPEAAARLNTPAWAWDAWVAAYGEETANAIGHAHLVEPPLDITPKGDTAEWSKLLEARILPTGTLRRAPGGRIEDLPGYLDGAWWIQDAAAAIPATLLGSLKGRVVIDLCAAPGGKTAQLAAAGAKVTAVDLAFDRMKRVVANLERLSLNAEIVVADALDWRPKEPADAVLLDAPCSASGTVRRHPDVLWRKDQSDVLAQADLQGRLLASAAEMVKPGGGLLYGVCSLAREESEDIIEAFLSARPDFERAPIAASDVGGEAQFLTRAGDLRTLPCHWADIGGLDGFYVCRLRRTALGRLRETP
jgi:16S rRNA (cytosine967-C5)-methyltransferase